MVMKMNKYYCKHCGRELDKKYPNMLCKKHYDQWVKYGFFLEDNPMTENDPNEIERKEDYAIIFLYDNLNKVYHDSLTHCIV